MIRKTRTALSFVTAMAIAFATGIAGADTEMHGRVSFTDQSALVKGSDDADWSYAPVNSLVMPGDSVWADDESALELEFSGGTFVRLADGSRIEVLDVPPNALFRGTTGSFYVHRVRRSNGDFTFDTPVGAINIAPDSQVRVDILEEGATTVTVRWGSATLHSEGGEPITVGTGEQSFIDPGYIPSAPIVFDRSQEDAFDTWNRSRTRLLAEGSKPTPIQSSYSGGSAPVGMSDLNGYGEWVYIDNTPYWRPTVVDYVPYRYGSWSYVPAHGYVWCDYYPWAYATTHYGHWNYTSRYGWCWRYSGYYRPAYAYTVRYGDRFIWAPLSAYGYPVCYDSYASFTIGSVRFSYGFSSYSYDRYVWAGGYHNVWFVDRDCIYDRYNRYRYNDCDYWRIDTDKRPYKGAGRPHWPGSREDTFAPDRVYRGAPSTSDGSMRAGDRARTLEARQAPTRARGADVRTARANGSTPTAPAVRQANTRQVRLADPSLTRIARGPDTVRPTGSAAARGRTYSNDDARGAAPLSGGSLAERPRTPSERSNAPASDSVQNESSRVRPSSPGVASRPQRSNGTSADSPTAPVRSGSSRPANVRPSRPATSPDQFDGPAERPQPTNSRPTVTRPQESTSPRVTAPSRAQGNVRANERVDNNPVERPRPTNSRPQVAETQRPQVSRPEPQRPANNQPSVDRSQSVRAAPARPSYDRSQQQVSRPEPQRPNYDRSQQQVSRPEPQRPNYDRQQSAPRSAPQAAPAPQRMESRPSAPSRSDSYNTPSVGGGSRGGGGGSAPSRSSGGGGSSRSRGD